MQTFPLRTRQPLLGYLNSVVFLSWEEEERKQSLRGMPWLVMVEGKDSVYQFCIYWNTHRVFSRSRFRKAICESLTCSTRQHFQRVFVRPFPLILRLTEKKPIRIEVEMDFSLHTSRDEFNGCFSPKAAYIALVMWNSHCRLCRS